jgi:hypothetical protein
MKNFFTSITITCAMVLLAGCGGSARKSDPKSVAREWLTRMYAADWKGAQELSTKECQDLIQLQGNFMDISPEESRREYKLTKFEIIGEPVITGNNAIVTYKSSDVQSETKLPLILVDGRWLINLTKDTYIDQRSGEDMPASGEEAVPISNDSVNSQGNATNSGTKR